MNSKRDRAADKKAPFTAGQPVPLVLDTYQAAYMLRMEYEHLLALVRNHEIGELPYKGGTHYRIPMKAIEAYIERHMIPAKPERNDET